MRWLKLGRSVPAPKTDPRSGIATQQLAPGYSSCLRCCTAWKFVKGHSTFYSEGRGCFPLCELCWSDLTPEERLPFYYVLFRQWEWDATRDGEEPSASWEDIERAVLAEAGE